jgi:hypothetical protein
MTTVQLPEEKHQAPPIAPPSSSAPFEKAVPSNKRIKLMIFGDAGSGKTFEALNAPEPCVIDCEAGSTCYSGIKKFHVIHATAADSIMAPIDWLLQHDHPYQSLILDPVSVFWESLQSKWIDILMRRNKGSKGYRQEYYELSARDWGLIKQDLKKFFRKLTMLDMNLILICREKVKYRDSGFMIPDGTTFDGEKSLPYLCDTLVRCFKSKSGEFLSECIKDRTQTLPSEPFQTSELINLLMGGEEARISKPIKQISEKQKATLTELLADYDPLAVKQSLASFNAEDISDLSSTQAEKIIGKILSATNA